MTVGDDRLVERFATGYDVVEVVVAGLSEAILRYRPAPEQWSVHCVIVHLADSELQFHVRLRSILADEHCLLPGHDEHAWSVEADYDAADRVAAWGLIRLLRTVNADFLRRLPAARWCRAGTHTQRGRITVTRLVEEAVEHVDQHLAQIRRLLATHAERDAER